MESQLHKLPTPVGMAMGLGTRHVGGSSRSAQPWAGWWGDRVARRTPPSGWGSGRRRRGKGTSVRAAGRAPEGLCLLPGAHLLTRAPPPQPLLPALQVNMVIGILVFNKLVSKDGITDKKLKERAG